MKVRVRAVAIARWFTIVLLPLAAGFLPAPWRIPVHSSYSPPTLLYAANKKTATTTYEPTITAKLDPVAREILNLIAQKYGNNLTPASYRKIRHYVYQASVKATDKLTVQQAKGVLDFIESNFDAKLCRSILQTCPRILRKNPVTYLKPHVEFLEELYGSELYMQALSRNPNLLLASGIGYQAPNADLEDYLTNELFVSKAAVKKLQRSAPFLFSMSLERIQAFSSYLQQFLLAGGFTNKEARKVCGKILATYPRLVNISVEANLKPRIQFLRSTCRLDDKDVATLIKSSPMVLGLSVEENLRPTLDFFLSLVKKDRNALKKLIQSHPQLLGLSIKNLQTKVDYFRAIDRDLPSRFAMRCPVVYQLSLKENIIPTVDFLAKVWGTQAPRVSWDNELGMKFESRPDHEERLESFLYEHPAVLTLSLEGNIQPTMRFFNQTGYTELDRDWQLQGDRIMRGGYISASLFQRLLPRWHYLREQAIDTNEEDYKLPSLYLLAGVTDRAFCTKAGCNVDDYLKFKAETAPHLKFDSQFDTWVKTGRPIDKND